MRMSSHQSFIRWPHILTVTCSWGQSRACLACGSDCHAWFAQCIKTLKTFQAQVVQQHPFRSVTYGDITVITDCLSCFLLSSQDSSSDGQGEDRGLPCVHAGHTRRTTGPPGKGQGLHLWLCVWHRLRAADHLRGLRVQANWGLLRGLQRHRVRLWSGMTRGLDLI